MEELLTSSCCICVSKLDELSTLDTLDSNNVRYIKKLVLCVPNETWESYYKICYLCIAQLDITYDFVQCCVESEKFRQKEPDNFSQTLGFKCDECGKTFRQKKRLVQHITTLHMRQQNGKSKLKLEEEISNEHVSLEVEQKEEQEALIETESIKLDPYCDDVWNDDDDYEDKDFNDYVKPELDNEIKGKKEISPKREPCKCTFCDEIFKTKQEWVQHVRTEHASKKPFACEQCDASYLNKYSLQIHMRKHTNEKPFVCATCGKSFNSSASLNHHAKIHTGTRPYACPQCDRSFKTHNNLRTHRLQVHQDRTEWQFFCDLCDKKFPLQSNLRKHLKRHAGIKEFACHICGKLFVNKAELIPHLNTHSNQRLFKCSLCDHKDYKNREGLRRHMKVVHDQGNWKAPKLEKKYCCAMCPKVFAFSNKLQRHIFTHTGEKPYSCDYCQKRFIDKYTLKVHLKKDHNMDLFE
ncbi:zinc finger protein 771-like [Anthonomus grandis grandis]|uniref:zinc finger protein 771-like n=1 Tax=Anthonomus grandis grandis TaxID=2921223 RepID=UPI002165389F|nr:zinc finger protein 771-like [Anthonomus grandis grandis]